MCKKKRCPYCRCLFWPNPRSAKRQRVCSKPSCQKRRRQDTQRRYREKNPGETQARRYRAAIAALKEEPPTPMSLPREALFRSSLWEEIKDVIEPQLFVTLIYFVRLLWDRKKDEIRSQSTAIKEEFLHLLEEQKKDEIAAGG